jgi:predicted metal-dependent hydrolase
MAKPIQLGDLVIAVTRKEIKHVHLSVHPPVGRVTLAVPKAVRPEVARAFAISKLGWIRAQQAKLLGQVRETPRQFVSRESHYVWGRRYLLYVVEKEAKPSVRRSHRTITLTVRPGSTSARRQQIMHEWHKSLMHQEVPPLIRKWEDRLGVTVSRYFLQRMKTKWGSCNHRAGHVRLNTQLITKPKDLLEYVIAHEIAHLLQSTHTSRFVAILDDKYPSWREARMELNELPLTAEVWKA